MKQLTKEQLYGLVDDKWKRITEANAEKVKEHILEYIKGTENNYLEMLVKYITIYGYEIEIECYRVLAEVLYEILYSEDDDNLKGENIK